MGTSGSARNPGSHAGLSCRTELVSRLCCAGAPSEPTHPLIGAYVVPYLSGSAGSSALWSQSYFPQSLPLVR